MRVATKPSATRQVLREIRDELRQTNERLSGVERRQTETETRLATELVAVARLVGEVRDVSLAARSTSKKRRLCTPRGIRR